MPGHVACQCHVGAYAGKHVIVVDEDIDVSNLDELIWAMLTRSDPATSIDIVHNAWSTPIDPRISPEEKAKGKRWAPVSAEHWIRSRGGMTLDKTSKKEPTHCASPKSHLGSRVGS